MSKTGVILKLHFRHAIIATACIDKRRIDKRNNWKTGTLKMLTADNTNRSM